MKLPDCELEKMIAAGERQRLELKREFRNARADICKDICGYSNDIGGSGEPGYIVIGVEDNGRSSGLKVDDALLQQVGQIRLDGQIVPWPVMAVEARCLNGSEAVVIEVSPHPHPPVRYEGRVWIHAGTCRALASPQDEIRLAERRRGADLPFVLRNALGTTIDALDLDYCERHYIPAAFSRDVLEANERPLLQKLASLRLISADASVPTYGGLLLTGFDPVVFVPGAATEFFRFQGVGRSDALRNQHRLSGGLLSVFQQIEALLPLYIEVASRPGAGLRRTDIALYPAWALREYIFNAIIHRNYENTAAPTRVDWYDDRVEITSPGGLFGHVTPSNFRHMNDYRNELLAVAAKSMGWVEKAGQGIARAEQLLAANGNPQPEYEFEPEYVLVRVRSARL